MNMVFQRENFADCFYEAMPLIQNHYDEIAWQKDKIPLDLDEELYCKLDMEGIAIFYTGRVRGEIKAYNVFFIRANPHYKSTRFATNDVIYVDPEYRGGTGSKFIDFCEEDLRSLGAQVITYHIKPSFDWGVLLKRKKFTPLDSIWVKWVGDQ